MRFTGILLAGSICLAAGVPVAAQTDGPPVHVTVVEGPATIERDGRVEDLATSMPVLPGDRLQTTTGRVELLFRDGSRLAVDRDTQLDLLDRHLVRLLDGRIRWFIVGTARYRLDAAPATVALNGPGEFRIDLVPDPSERLVVAVARGVATVENVYGATTLGAGEQASVTPERAPTEPQRYNAAQWDAFDRWADQRRIGHRIGVSSRYLPPALSVYAGTLDRYGHWSFLAGYGYVWFPRVVAGWRPYFFGRWRYVPPFGWMWVGHDPWVWPTHYYGRWGFVGSVWFWIPGTVWAPAWVSWVRWPGFVAWCPLGIAGRPVVDFFVFVDRGGRRELRWYQADGRYDARGVFDAADGAWTALPRAAFESGTDVSRHAADPRAAMMAARRRLVETAPPEPPALARNRETTSTPGAETRTSGADDRSGRPRGLPAAGAVRPAGEGWRRLETPRGAMSLPLPARPGSEQEHGAGEASESHPRGGAHGVRVPRDPWGPPARPREAPPIVERGDEQSRAAVPTPAPEVLRTPRWRRDSRAESGHERPEAPRPPWPGRIELPPGRSPGVDAPSPWRPDWNADVPRAPRPGQGAAVPFRSVPGLGSAGAAENGPIGRERGRGGRGVGARPPGAVPSWGTPAGSPAVPGPPPAGGAAPPRTERSLPQ